MMKLSSSAFRMVKQLVPGSTQFCPKYFSSQTRVRCQGHSQNIHGNHFNRKRLFVDVVKTLGLLGGSYASLVIYNHECDKTRNSIFNFKINTDTPGRDILRKLDFEMKNFNEVGNVFKAILVANTLIFGCWNFNIGTGILQQYFTVYPGSPFISNFLCQYSHMNLSHLFLNMYCLNSFVPIASRQMSGEEFLTLYTLGGTLASLSSKIFKVLTYSNSMSLGASGCIMSVLGYLCTRNPDSRFTIPFIGPALDFSFTADTAVKGIIAVELAMMVLGIGNIDNIAHLTGFLFGIWYATDQGQKYMQKSRKFIIKKWNEISNDK